ncbi:MAG TPA: hypothetical protein DCM28_16645 [Phycisphaerales bacterium]|nr:hypothetical protein [Phycisphaerales bacterium]
MFLRLILPSLTSLPRALSALPERPSVVQCSLTCAVEQPALALTKARTDSSPETSNVLRVRLPDFLAGVFFAGAFLAAALAAVFLFTDPLGRPRRDFLAGATGTAGAAAPIPSCWKVRSIASMALT